MSQVSVIPTPLDGYSVLSNDKDSSLKAVAFKSGEIEFAFPVNKEIATDLAKMFAQLAEELPDGPQAN